ncbi:hypothetical protein N7534_003702 [Penicillium rubens]|nr:hypothetical protein N7524_003785 [Penicillium chrysogenum]KAJ5858425.1 hypothetical protein N7534_003702 [Penicillium rubens]
MARHRRIHTGKRRCVCDDPTCGRRLYSPNTNTAREDENATPASLRIGHLVFRVMDEMIIKLTIMIPRAWRDAALRCLA